MALTQPAALAAATETPAGTAPAQRFAALDAFRAIGSTMVVATHVAFVTGTTSGGPFQALLARLDIGVAVFFVLSGFLLFRPHAAAAAGLGAPQSTRHYLIRRAARILPAYWLLVLVSFLVLPANDDASFADWLRHLTLTQIYEDSELRAGISQAWSLCTEVAFYIVLPGLAFLLVRRSPWRPARTVALLALAIPIGPLWLYAANTLPFLDTFTASLWLPVFAGWFAVGMALAVASVAVSEGRGGLWRTISDLGRAPMACWAIAAAALAISTTPIAGPAPLEDAPTLFEANTKTLLYAAFAVFLLLPAVFPPADGRLTVRLLASRPVGYLGSISYGIFLWHVVALDLILEALDIEHFTGGFGKLFALTFLTASLAAVLSYHFVEEPIQQWSRRATRRRRTSPTAPSERRTPEAA